MTTRLLSVRSGGDPAKWIVVELDNPSSVDSGYQIAARLQTRAEGIAAAIHFSNHPTIANVEQAPWELISVVDLQDGETMLFFRSSP